MIQVYPSPFDTTSLTYQGVPTRNSPLSTYSYVSSTAFEVKVFDDVSQNYSSAFVYKCGSTSAWASWQNGLGVYGAGVTGAAQNSLTPWTNKTAAQFNYLNFDTDYSTKIRVGYKKATVTSVDICPHRKNYGYSVIAPSTIEISGINAYDKVVITVNNDLSTPLYVFANPIEAAPSPTAVDLYFSAGIWEISAINNALGLDTNPSSNFRYQISANNYDVYIAPGAYIDGTLSVRGKSNINIYGRGVIDAYRPDDWWQRWSWEAPGGIIDADKLIRGPIFAWSSFEEQYPRTLECSNIYLAGFTIVNSIIYATTVNAKSFDNLKLISQWPNCDGFRPTDRASPDPLKYSSVTRCFMQVADDAIFPKKADGNCLVSSCYVINLAGATFRDYYGIYNYKYLNGHNYGWSAIDIDFKTYSSPSYVTKSVPLYEPYNNSVFGLWQTDKVKSIAASPNSQYNLVGDIFISGVYSDNLVDIPIFDIGIRSYPDSDGQSRDYTEAFGNISSIVFKDIYVSSHPNSKYNWTKRNMIFGTENSNRYRPYDLSFINVNIDGTTITETNKNNYFDWYYRPFAPDNDPTIPSYIGSSIVDLYLVLGDSIAYGVSSFYADRANTGYASMPSELTGCYIFRPGRAYDQTGLPAGDWPKFDVIRPGVNTNQLDYPLAPKDPQGDTGLESLLAWKLRQNSGDRDVYIIKCAVGGTMALSGTSAVWGSTTDWSVSSSGEMFSKFTASATAAINILKNQNKNINFAGAVICLGSNIPIQAQRYINDVTSTPNPLYDPALVSSLIDTDLSSLVSGVRGVLGFSSLNVDSFYSKFIWVAPLFGVNSVSYDTNYFGGYGQTFRNKLQQLKSAIPLSSSFYSTRTDYYLPPTGAGRAVGGDSPFLADYVHYNFSGYAKIADDILFNLKLRNRSVTDPTLNPEVNYQFYPKPAVEIYDNPFEAEKTYTLYTNDRYKSEVSSSNYNVSIYDENLGIYVSSFVYRCGHTRSWAPWAGSLYSVHGSGNPVDDGYKIGLAPWGPSAPYSLNYTNFGISGPCTVKIDYKRPPRNGQLQTSDISIGPFNKNKQFSIQGTSSIIIQNVNIYDQLAVEILYDTSNPLFLFANPYQETRPTVYVTPTTMSAFAGSPGDTIYFGPGFYELSSFAARNYALPIDDNKVSSLPEWSFSAQNDQTLYIDGGAYIRGNIDLKAASGLNIIGYGIIEPYWLQDWYERISPIGGPTKLRLSPFRGYSSFENTSPILNASKHSNIVGPTVVNNVTYFNTSRFKHVDNVKYFGVYSNCDGPRFADYPEWTPLTYSNNTTRINGYASYTRSFQLVGDDAITSITDSPTMGLLVSSIYVWNVAGGVIRHWDIYYSFREALRNNLLGSTSAIIGGGFSAYDMDVRNYVAPTYEGLKTSPLHNRARVSLIGMWSSRQGIDSCNNNCGMDTVLVSGFRVENPTDIPLFDIGQRYYPFISEKSTDFENLEYSIYRAYPIKKGKITDITLKDISISSHPSSIGKYVYSNAIFGANGIDVSSQISDITLNNVRIDGIPITNVNYNNFIAFKQIPIEIPLEIRNRQSWISNNHGSAIIDFYVVIGGGMVAGTSGAATDLLNYSEYSSLYTGVPGCYIFRGIQANATTGEFGAFTGPRFEEFRPGKNTIAEQSIITDPNNSMGPEVSLFNRLKQQTDRDIYVLKLARPASLAFSGVSATWGTAAGDWSVSSSNELFDKFKSWCGSAISILHNQNKVIDFKGAVIMAGEDVPSYYTDEEFTRNIIQTEISSLYFGIRNSISNSSVDVNNLNVIWSIPPSRTGTSFPNYFSSIKTNASALSIQDFRFNYFELSTIPSVLAPNNFFYNTSGHLVIGERLADMFISQASSVTDPALNPDVNFSFGLSNGMRNWVKVNGEWKEADTWIKKDGVWKFATPFVKGSNQWKTEPTLELYSPGTELLRSSKFTVDVSSQLDVENGHGGGFSSAYVFSRARPVIAAYGLEFTGLAMNPTTNPPRTRLWVSGSSPEMSFLTFGASGLTKVKVEKIGTPITSAKLRPKSKNWNYQVTGGYLEVNMNPMDKVWVEVNNDTSSPLFIFCDPKKPSLPTGNFAYFGPGITHVSSLPGSNSVTLTGPAGVSETFVGVNFSSFDQNVTGSTYQITPYVPGQDYTIYIDGGAYVIGSFDLRGKNNIKVIGPGIMSMQNMPKERLENPGLSMNITYDYFAHRDAGSIPIRLNTLYEETNGGNNSFSGLPSGCFLSGVTIVDTPFYAPAGFNYIDSLKIISPWSYNTDGPTTMPDRLLRKHHIKDSFYFVADDCIFAPNNMKSQLYDPTGSFPLAGGEAVYSGITMYTMNNGPIALSYTPKFYYDDQNKSYPAIIHDCDVGSYAYSRPHIETFIRMTQYNTAIEGRDPKNLGLYDLTVSNIRVEEPIDGSLFWVGSLWDPFQTQTYLFGAISGITIADIDASSSDRNPGLSDFGISSMPIWGLDTSSRPYNITFKNIKINGEYITNENRDNFIDWVSGPGRTGSGFTDPDVYSSNITFVTGTP